MNLNKALLQSKIETRYHSRELIKAVFIATENFLKADQEQFGPLLRKKALGISSYLTHGTVKSNVEEQKEDFIIVMGELRELLKLITIANHLGYTSDKDKAIVRLGISTLINSLDKLVILLGGFEPKS
ncbi:four helix bundle protein [Crocinitomix catalasitica]|uniref:four helix bundle protein n=1 Tax=Crocinitomix catalasitica TaxID=184607 RepID=UPI000482B57C|nr:four helix bundle protein [Crocinitomix catalasitica]